MSVRQAALTHGVDPKQLGVYLKTGRSYKGQGITSKHFTPEEETILTERFHTFFNTNLYSAFLCRILALSTNGENLTLGLIRKVLIEECSIIKKNNPDRTMFSIDPETGVHNISDGYIQGFIQRTGLTKYFDMLRDKVTRNFSCEVLEIIVYITMSFVYHELLFQICYQKFTMKNAMVAHQKRKHSAFF